MICNIKMRIDMNDNLFEKLVEKDEEKQRIRQIQAVLLRDDSNKWIGKPKNNDQFLDYLMAAGIAGKTLVIDKKADYLAEAPAEDLPYCPLIVNDDRPILEIGNRVFTQKELLAYDREALKKLIE